MLWAAWRDRAALASTPAAPGIDLHAPCTEAVYALARKLLWIAYVWNDHNFDHPYQIARKLAQEFGIESFDQANAWLTEQAKLIDASPKGGSDCGRVLAMARDAWQASDEARMLANDRNGLVGGKYLRNRLEVAFCAGFDAAMQATSAEVGA